jgi:N-acetylneuraminic acid mutarotase
MAENKDGRIYFVADSPPGDLAEYVPVPKVWVKGDMRCDSALKNIDTELGKESGEWRPCVPIPIHIIRVPSATVLNPADYPVGTLRIDSNSPFKTFHASDTSVPPDGVADEWQEICQKQDGVPQGGVIIAQDGVNLTEYGYSPKYSKVRTYERLHEPWDLGHLWRPARGQIIFQLDATNFVVGTGTYSETWWSDLLSSLWKFDMETGLWSYWGEFPVAMNNGVAVTVANDGSYDIYAGTGLTSYTNWNSQMWHWNTEEEAWESASDVDYGFNSGIACTIWRKVSGNWVKTALVGLGDVGSAGRCYYYDGVNWVYVGSPFPGANPARTGAIAFTIDSAHETYIGLGTSGITDYRDIWILSWYEGKWGEAGFVWSQTPLTMPDIERCDAVSYVTEDEIAYICMGRNMKSGVLDTWWSYNPSSDTWQRENAFDGEARHDCTGIYMDGKAFIIGGYNIGAAAFYGDIWMSHRLWLWVKGG